LNLKILVIQGRIQGYRIRVFPLIMHRLKPYGDEYKHYFVIIIVFIKTGCPVDPDKLRYDGISKAQSFPQIFAKIFSVKRYVRI